MNCPYCGQEMAVGYLRGERSYSLLWTDDPFKVTDMAFGNDLRLCKATDINKPKAHLCKACRRIVLEIAGTAEI